MRQKCSYFLNGRVQPIYLSQFISNRYSFQNFYQTDTDTGICFRIQIKLIPKPLLYWYLLSIWSSFQTDSKLRIQTDTDIIPFSWYQYWYLPSVSVLLVKQIICQTIIDSMENCVIAFLKYRKTCILFIKEWGSSLYTDTFIIYDMANHLSKKIVWNSKFQMKENSWKGASFSLLFSACES